MIPEITFQNPNALYLLVLLLPLAWLMARARKLNKEVRDQLNGSSPNRPAWRDHVRILAAAIIALCLAKPGYNPVPSQLASAGRDVVFILDVSRSMLAEDVQPNRLESAKQAIRDTVEGFTSQRVGLVLYAGSTSIACPLTSDYDFLRYMLDQASPWAVEFGGTMLNDGVEKTLEQVFTDDRVGFQDIILITDGEDHGPDMQKVAARISEAQVGLLAIGLGDAENGAKIPEELEDGTMSFVQYKDEDVITKLDNQSLETLCSASENFTYFSAGTRPFYLADTYQDFAKNKQQQLSVGNDTFMIYKEASFFLMPLALILLVIPHLRIKTNSIAVILVVMAAMPNSSVYAQSKQFVSKYDMAIDHMKLEQMEEAQALLIELRSKPSDIPSVDAAVLLNLGICTDGLAKEMPTPQEQLDLAMSAQQYYLRAARMQPGYHRAAHQLQVLHGNILALREQIANEADDSQDMNQSMQKLIEDLEELKDKLISAREKVQQVNPPAPRRNRRHNDPPPPAAPEHAAAALANLKTQSNELKTSADQIHEDMKELHEVMYAMLRESAGLSVLDPSELDDSVDLNAPVDNAKIGEHVEVDELETIFEEPLKIMPKVPEQITVGSNQLNQWNTAFHSLRHYNIAAEHVQEILDLLANSNSSQDSDSEESEMDEWDDYEYDESDGESQMMSMAMEGDFNSSESMQQLPPPNFSPEDILQEEMASQQFRQKQQSKSKAASAVEKDW
ncbi:VWA domain-containing protein [Persicirhabdus sediminis]|uniref:VWA domain-containing protein n=1 Tax=Persicirhabdus sediminis TaxID=454144 RepID=A0A8J7SK20_9BACT|nr:VWA domain-containing protein [Persicirhabdus sediminis]MBK1792555.1 VWA domain-containing protein [Persicirhabdus sediminis]